MPSHRARRTPARLTRGVAALLAATLVSGFAGALLLRARPDAGTSTEAVRGRVAKAFGVDAEREQAVRDLLQVRAGAMRDRDRGAWLSTVEAGPFRERQAALFDALADVPISDWSYQLDPTTVPPPNVDLDKVRGPGWWSPGVTLTYRVTGYDAVPTVEVQHLTFVPRGPDWLIAADDDFAAAGRDTARALWDAGPVIALRGLHCIVFGHPGSRATMRRVATSVDAAVPRVVRVWGSDWPQRVVALVPSSQGELQRVVGGGGDYTQIAAVATAELTDTATGSRPVGDRIVINPPNFAKLGSLGRRVVLTHEVTHVATRSVTGPATPAWLVEGLADYVGYLGVRVPYRVSASELRDAVRRGDVPTGLPTDREFNGGNDDLAKVYEESWLAVSLIAEQHGRAGLLRFYRAVGAARASTAADDVFRSLWGTDLDAFTTAWRHDLTTRLQ